jgi:hypothetical protein
MVGEKGMVEKAKGIMFDNESGLYFVKYFNEWWLIDTLDEKEAGSAGVAKKEYDFYKNENKTIMAARNAAAQAGKGDKTPPQAPAPPRQVPVEIVGPEQEAGDAVEAQDISQNSDMVLQYEAPFTDKKTGEKVMRKWLGVNAWKLGLIEGYIKQGFSCDISYEHTDLDVKCTVKLQKDAQNITVWGTYTKTRLKSFQQSCKIEVCETFAFRNAIRKIVSLKDVVVAVKAVQLEMKEMGLLATKEVKSLSE